jgi:hypothetical protein
MIRKLILVMTILALAAVPAGALAWDGGHGGRHEFRGGHERFEPFHRSLIGLYPYPYDISTSTASSVSSRSGHLPRGSIESDRAWLACASNAQPAEP